MDTSKQSTPLGKCMGRQAVTQNKSQSRGNVSMERLLSMCYIAELKNVYSESLDLKYKMKYGRNLGRE